jgi:plastocyanin
MQLPPPLDGVNLLIGTLTLIIGLLGLVYVAAIFIVTPQPQVEPAEAAEYPDVDRWFVPFFLPVGVFLIVGTVILLISQILLVVPEQIATPIALGLAVLILVAGSAAANSPKLSKGKIITLIALPAVILVVAGVTAGGYRFHTAQVEAAAEAQRAATATTTTPTEITTDNLFSRVTLNVPVGQPVTLTLQNKGLNIHNWHVLAVRDPNGNDIATQLTQPGQQSTVSFVITTAGVYKYQCDVHPTEMTGQLTVKQPGS